MKKKYSNIPLSQIEKQKQYFYGAIIDLLFRQEAGYPLLNERIQTLINQIEGSNKIFGYQPQVLSMVACLEHAREHPDQFRKDILDAANLVDTLKGGDEDV